MPWRFTESLHTAEVTRLVQKFFGKSCCESLALDDLIFYDSLDLIFQCKYEEGDNPAMELVLRQNVLRIIILQM